MASTWTLHIKTLCAIGLGEAWAHAVIHDINAQMVHCHTVNMGLTAEVKGCVFNEWHPVFRQGACCFVFMSELFSLVFRRHALYSTSLPMCYCVHVKDWVPQLGYKKHICGNSEKTGNSMPCSASIKDTVGQKASNFPTPSTSFWGIHV